MTVAVYMTNFTMLAINIQDYILVQLISIKFSCVGSFMCDQILTLGHYSLYLLLHVLVHHVTAKDKCIYYVTVYVGIVYYLLGVFG